jgi:hypothetical protein
MSCGRRGLPACVVTLMFADYQRLNSLSKVAALHGRTRQSIFQIFKNHGLPMNTVKRHAVVVYLGRKFTPGKNGYLRDTLCRRRKSVEQQLHRIVWQDIHGPIPAGWRVSFKDGNKSNCAPDNLFCAPTAEVSRFHYRRLFKDRADMTPEQRREFWKKHYRERAAKRAAEFVKKGLRTDGLPRRRGVPHRPGELRYFPPGRKNPEWIKTHETGRHKTLRRKVASFSGKRTQFDQLYDEIRAGVPRCLHVEDVVTAQQENYA